MKIKFFNLNYITEKEINNFIKDKKVIDIKYQTKQYIDMILIMYEE